MGLPSTMYRFEVEVSDVDGGVYQSFELRIARHPSETMAFMLTRLLAYALHLNDGVELSRAGLCDPEDPPLFVRDLTGRMTLWIDIGHPSTDRLHKAGKKADRVVVYTHKDPAQLLDAIGRARVHRAEELDIWSVDPSFLDELSEAVGRKNNWSLVRSGGELFVTAGDTSVSGALTRHPIEAVSG